MDALASGAQVDSELAALKASIGGAPQGEIAGAQPSAGAAELPAGGTFEQPPAPGTAAEPTSTENLR